MTNQTYISLSSLAMDLKRVALGKFHGSNLIADRFLDEALKRKNEIDPKRVAPYIRQILQEVELLKTGDQQRVAESSLMFSILLQNYSVKEFSSKL